MNKIWGPGGGCGLEEVNGGERRTYVILLTISSFFKYSPAIKEFIALATREIFGY